MIGVMNGLVVVINTRGARVPGGAPAAGLANVMGLATVAVRLSELLNGGLRERVLLQSAHDHLVEIDP